MKKNKLLTTLAIVSIVLFAGCKNDDYVAIDGGPCPVVVSTTPVSGATLVGRSAVKSETVKQNAARTTLVTAKFNKKIDPKTITESSFTVTGVSAIAGTVSYSNTDSTATFTAASKFADNTTFIAKITTSVKDLMGNALQTDYVWTFSTGITPAPMVSSTSPIANGLNVLFSQVVVANFTRLMDPSTLIASNFTLQQGVNVIAGTVTKTTSSISFTPTVVLTANTVYTATVTTGAKDADGTALQSNYVWSFTTINVYSLNVTAVNGTVAKNLQQLTYNSGTDVILTPTPATGFSFSSWSGDATGSANPLTVKMTATKNITANFTSNASNFALNVTALNGSVSRNPDQQTYTNGTSVQLTATPNQGYTFDSWSGDVSGSNSLATIIMNANKNVTANFTALAPQGPGVVDLKSAAAFTILSKSEITTTGVTSITGDIGVSPSAATFITGFGLIMNTDGQSSHTPIVSGKVYATDYAVPTPAKMTTAVSDMENAFTTAMGMTTTVIVGLGAGDVSGMTLAPGLYKWSTGLLITNAGLTLSGGPNDTWVFQIAQGITVNNTAIIHLTGGAQAKNIFWITAKDAVIGSDVDFSGNILSQTLISLNSRAKVTGRLLAQTAVTLNASTVVLP